MVEKCMRSLCDGLMSWLLSIVGGAENSALLVEKWKVHVIQCCYKYFAHKRISQLFEIIVDFPESEPALKDLAVCLKVVDLKQKLIHSLGRR
jgi:anaphase-promoting complex subunit 2